MYLPRPPPPGHRTLSTSSSTASTASTTSTTPTSTASALTPRTTSAHIAPSFNMASCPALPLLAALPSSSPPAPARHQSLPPLPLLDLSTLPAVAAPAASNGPHSARRSVDAITTSLSAIRPYLLLGSQASLQRIFTQGSLPSPSLSCDSPFALTPRSAASNMPLSVKLTPTHVVSFTSGCTPQLAIRRLVTTRSGRPLSNAATQATHAPAWTTTQFPLRDDSRQTIDHVFIPVALTIDAVRACAGRVALVCAQGISRSAACAIAYLMLREGLTVEAAMSVARAGRPIVAPNTGFLAALARLETRLRRGRACDWWGVVRRVGKDAAAEAPELSLRRVFYGGEPRCAADYAEGHPEHERTRPPYVAEAVVDGEGLDSSMVVIVERKDRGGVGVWVGQFVPLEARDAAVALAKGMAMQQRSDYDRFGGPGGVHLGRVAVVEGGEGTQFDEEVERMLAG